MAYAWIPCTHDKTPDLEGVDGSITITKCVYQEVCHICTSKGLKLLYCWAEVGGLCFKCGRWYCHGHKNNLDFRSFCPECS